MIGIIFPFPSKPTAPGQWTVIAWTAIVVLAPWEYWRFTSLAEPTHPNRSLSCGDSVFGRSF